MPKQKNYTRETFVRKFFKDNDLPFPVQREEFLDYYSTIEGYSDIIEKFNKYIDFVNNKGYDAYIQTKDVLEETLINTIKNHPSYNGFPKNNWLPIQNLRNDLYKEDLVNKYFLSIDLNNANFFVLYKLGIVDTANYKEWVSRFTDDEQFINSKKIRQIIFGKLRPKAFEKDMQYFMTKFIYTADKDNVLSKDNLLILTKDEAIYSADNLQEMIALVESNILNEIFENCSIQLFKLVKTKYGYAKEYVLNSKGVPYSFHAVPKNYWLENYKLYKGLPTCEKDFLFLNEDRKLCKRLE